MFHSKRHTLIKDSAVTAAKPAPMIRISSSAVIPQMIQQGDTHGPDVGLTNKSNKSKSTPHLASLGSDKDRLIVKRSRDEIGGGGQSSNTPVKKPRLVLTASTSKKSLAE